MKFFNAGGLSAQGVMWGVGSARVLPCLSWHGDVGSLPFVPEAALIHQQGAVHCLCRRMGLACTDSSVYKALNLCGAWF